jgi:NADH dehydrogenase FAD-containing subunit
VNGHKRVVLVGAGHAHLYTLKHARAVTERGYECVLIAPGDFWYSGLATGMLGGHYPPSLDRIDVGALATRGGGRFVNDYVTRLDWRNRTLHLASGPPVTYAALSLNLGSETPAIEGEQERGERCFAVKPIHRLWDLHTTIRERLCDKTGPLPRVLIAGSGATAFELAANILNLGHDHDAKLSVTILASGGEVLKQLPRRAANALERSLHERGLTVVRRSRAKTITDDAVITKAGEKHGYDLFVNATGLKPPSLAREAGLPTTDDGAMVVDECLRSPVDAAIHGGGDCIAFDGGKLPKVGVYAIRQAPVLRHNLLAALTGNRPEQFRPQSRYLWIMNLGDGTGLAVRGTLWWQGRSAFRLKDWIDRRFLGQYRTD